MLGVCRRHDDRSAWLWHMRQKNAGIVDAPAGPGPRSRPRFSCTGAGAPVALCSACAWSRCGHLRLALTSSRRVTAMKPKTAAIATCATLEQAPGPLLPVFFEFQTLIVVLSRCRCSPVAGTTLDEPGAVARSGRCSSGSVSVAGRRSPTASCCWFRQPGASGADLPSGLWRVRATRTISSSGCTGSPTSLLAVGAPTGLAFARRAAADVRLPVSLGERHSIHRGAGGANAWRRLPPVPARPVRCVFPGSPKVACYGTRSVVDEDAGSLIT